MLACMMGAINESSLRRLEYVLAENKILRKQIRGSVKMNDADRRTLAEVGKKLGKQALKELGSIVSPDTILGWYRKLVAKKFDGSKKKRGPGRPRTPGLIQELVLRFARASRSWGYGRIIGALANLGHKVSVQSVADILKKHGVEPVPRWRQGTIWVEFILSHMAVMSATDFFTAEVLTLRGIVTYYVLFFIELGTRRVHLAGITEHPDETWMTKVARNLTMASLGFLSGLRFLLHDRDSRYSATFRATVRSGGVRAVQLPAHSPNLNAFAERWERSVKEGCLGRMILLGDGSLRRAVAQYLAHYHGERNQQGRANALLRPRAEDRVGETRGSLRCRQRLGGLLKFYHRSA